MSERENLINEDVVEFGAEDDLNRSKGTFPHPVILGFHVLFKLLALLAFILCELFSNSFVLNFIVIIILLVMDFWTVKNITGRLLVGLRWWNYVDDDGKSHWMYESKQGTQKNSINAAESRIFWSALFIAQIMWIVMFFLFLLKIKWLVLTVTANILNGANLYGYIKCRIGAGKSIREYASGAVSKQMFSSAFSMFSRPAAQDQAAGPTNTV